MPIAIMDIVKMATSGLSRLARGYDDRPLSPAQITTTNAFGQPNPVDEMHSLRYLAYKSLGYNYHCAGGMPAAFSPMSAYGVVTTTGSGFKFRGDVQGKGYDGQGFVVADVTARQTSPALAYETAKCTGFEGVIVSLVHPQSFTARTVIRTDLGPLQSKTLDGMKRVGIVSREFEDRFEVYSDDQIEARALLTPDFLERLLAFTHHYYGRGVQCAFLGGQFHVALEIDDRFDFVGGYDAPNFKSGSARATHEIGAMFLLLEAVQTLHARIGASGHYGADKARGAYYRDKLQSVMTHMPELESTWCTRTDVPADMVESRYIFDDALKGLLFPRF